MSEVDFFTEEDPSQYVPPYIDGGGGRLKDLVALSREYISSRSSDELKSYVTFCFSAIDEQIDRLCKLKEFEGIEPETLNADYLLILSSKTGVLSDILKSQSTIKIPSMEEALSSYALHLLISASKDSDNFIPSVSRKPIGGLLAQYDESQYLAKHRVSFEKSGLSKVLAASEVIIHCGNLRSGDWKQTAEYIHKVGKFVYDEAKKRVLEHRAHCSMGGAANRGRQKPITKYINWYCKTHSLDGLTNKGVALNICHIITDEDGYSEGAEISGLYDGKYDGNSNVLTYYVNGEEKKEMTLKAIQEAVRKTRNK